MKEYIGNSNIHSFVTVAMNKPKELNRLLEYIEKLIRPDLYQFEWIIVTNDSISTSSIPNVSIYEHAQGNISQLRNYGADFAKGEFITFLDVDMIFKQDFFEEIILKLKKVTNKTVLLHYIYGFNVEDTLPNRSIFEKISPMNVGQFLKTYEDVWSDYRKDVFQLYKDDLSMLRAPWVYGWSGAFTCNNSEFMKVKGFDESFNGWGAEDTDLSYRLFLNNNTFIISEKSPVIHFPHPSKSKDISKEYFNNRCKLFMKNPAIESELYKYITGINLNNVLNKLEVTVICSMSPVYAHHDLSAIKSKMKSNNLFIGTDSLGILKQLLPQEILVWSDRFEQVVN
ncbi:glycosyltransferase family 2 protein [Enterococcus mundtii]|nr:glycosyltransferase [Enterococcus mundtii]